MELGQQQQRKNSHCNKTRATKPAHRHTDTHTHTDTDKHTHTQTDTQTQTNTHTHKQTHCRLRPTKTPAADLQLGGDNAHIAAASEHNSHRTNAHMAPGQCSIARRRCNVPEQSNENSKGGGDSSENTALLARNTKASLHNLFMLSLLCFGQPFLPLVHKANAAPGVITSLLQQLILRLKLCQLLLQCLTLGFKRQQLRRNVQLALLRRHTTLLHDVQQ